NTRNGPNRQCPGRFEGKTARHRQEKWRFVVEIEPNSAAVIILRQDLLKTSGYSRCPKVIHPAGMMLCHLPLLPCVSVGRVCSSGCSILTLRIARISEEP